MLIVFSPESCSTVEELTEVSSRLPWVHPHLPFALRMVSIWIWTDSAFSRVVAGLNRISHVLVCGIPVFPSYNLSSHFLVHLPIWLLLSPGLASASSLVHCSQEVLLPFSTLGFYSEPKPESLFPWPTFLHSQYNNLRFWALHFYWTCHCSESQWSQLEADFQVYIIPSCSRGQPYPFWSESALWPFRWTFGHWVILGFFKCALGMTWCFLVFFFIRLSIVFCLPGPRTVPAFLYEFWKGQPVLWYPTGVGILKDW